MNNSGRFRNKFIKGISGRPLIHIIQQSGSYSNCDESNRQGLLVVIHIGAKKRQYNKTVVNYSKLFLLCSIYTCLFAKNWMFVYKINHPKCFELKRKTLKRARSSHVLRFCLQWILDLVGDDDALDVDVFICNIVFWPSVIWRYDSSIVLRSRIVSRSSSECIFALARQSYRQHESFVSAYSRCIPSSSPSISRNWIPENLHFLHRAIHNTSFRGHMP